jgi:hypothetical protein
MTKQEALDLADKAMAASQIAKERGKMAEFVALITNAAQLVQLAKQLEIIERHLTPEPPRHG